MVRVRTKKEPDVYMHYDEIFESVKQMSVRIYEARQSYTHEIENERVEAIKYVLGEITSDPKEQAAILNKIYDRIEIAWEALADLAVERTQNPEMTDEDVNCKASEIWADMHADISEILTREIKKEMPKKQIEESVAYVREKSNVIVRNPFRYLLNPFSEETKENWFKLFEGAPEYMQITLFSTYLISLATGSGVLVYYYQERMIDDLYFRDPTILERAVLNLFNQVFDLPNNQGFLRIPDIGISPWSIGRFYTRAVEKFKKEGIGGKEMIAAFVIGGPVGVYVSPWVSEAAGDFERLRNSAHNAVKNRVKEVRDRTIRTIESGGAAAPTTREKPGLSEFRWTTEPRGPRKRERPREE